MSLSFCVLASGSKGNSTLLVVERDGVQQYMLIDCGLSMRATAERLAPLGVTLDEISAIVLTHLDWDHFQNGWRRRIDRDRIPVHLHLRHRKAALRRGLEGRHMQLFKRPFLLPGGTAVEPVHLAHDNLGTAGFIFEHDGARFGFATDLGAVSRDMGERFIDLHALAIESNYDRQMQLTSNRPLSLKRRIMGGAGHLSNEQSLEAVMAIDARSKLSHVVTLHLSQQCNDPRLIKNLYTERAGHLVECLTITSQHEPSPMLRVGPSGRAPAPRPGEQLAMFDA